MAKYTSISYLSSQDKEAIKDILDGTRFQVVADIKGFHAYTYGDGKFNHHMIDEIESELASLGLNAISTNIWWKQ